MSDQGSGNDQPGGWTPPPPPPPQNFQGGNGGFGQGPQVPDYMVWSILETILCCLPLGIAGIIYSSRANSKKAQGDINGALVDAAMAKKLLIIGVVVGGVMAFLYVLLVVGLGLLGTTADTNGY